MRNPSRNARVLIICSLVFVLARSGWAEGGWRPPLDPVSEPELSVPVEPLRPGVDPCGCLRELRSCLIAATLNLGRCLSWAHTPARQALCYIKFELDVLICLDRAGSCEQTCVP